MGFYNLWCKNENRYKLHSVTNTGNEQIIHCLSCGLHRKNSRTTKHSSISSYLLKQENLNYHWGNRKQRQLLKEQALVERKNKYKNIITGIGEEIKRLLKEAEGMILWLVKKIQKN